MYHHPNTFSSIASTNSAAAASPTSRSVLAVVFSLCAVMRTAVALSADESAVRAVQVKFPPPLRRSPGRSMFRLMVSPYSGMSPP